MHASPAPAWCLADAGGELSKQPMTESQETAQAFPSYFTSHFLPFVVSSSLPFTTPHSLSLVLLSVLSLCLQNASFGEYSSSQSS